MEQSYFQISSAFINDVEKFSKDKLKRKAELIRIYEEALKSNNEKLFDDLAFTAKYVQGLMRVVKSGSVNPDIKNLDSIKKDFTDNMNKVVLKIKELISSADENLKIHFEQTYFELSQQGFVNLAELLSDLEWTKIYLNDSRRNQN
jgi:hypothetical protein